MKWERYNKMTPEHKEEWNFRFKDKLHIDWYNPSKDAILVFTGTSFLILLGVEMINVKILFLFLFKCVMWFFLLINLAFIINYIYWNVKSNNWLKARGY